MTPIEKKSKLIHLAEQTLAIPTFQEEFRYLFSNLNVTRKEVIQAFIVWDFDPDAYGNEFYDSIAARFAMHIKNRTPGSWHIERQKITSTLLQQSPPLTLVDVGFGVPQQYLRDVILKQRIKSKLLDVYPSAIIFARALLSYWDQTWPENIELIEYDMNTNQALEPSETYLFQDSIEHAKNPTEYLENTVSRALVNARFIFSLPIAVGTEHEPSHSINWSIQIDAEKWLKQSGLEIITAQPIYPDPEVDIYAQGLAPGYFQLIVDCKKAATESTY